MQSAEQLADFVHRGLVEGHTPEVLGEALTEAGWSPREVSQALACFHPAPAQLPGLPVPRPRPYLSARDAVLYGLLFITLGDITWNLGVLGWQIIEVIVRDPGDFYYGPGGGMRFAIASLVVFVPVFLWLNKRIGRGSPRDAAQGRSLVRKWFASITVVIAAVILLGDLVAVIYAGLNGDLTLRFLMKALWVAALGAVVLAYMRGEVDGD